MARRPCADGGAGDLDPVAVDVGDLVVDADDDKERPGGRPLGMPLVGAGSERLGLRRRRLLLLEFLEELRFRVLAAEKKEGAKDEDRGRFRCHIRRAGLKGKGADSSGGTGVDPRGSAELVPIHLPHRVSAGGLVHRHGGGGVRTAVVARRGSADPRARFRGAAGREQGDGAGKQGDKGEDGSGFHGMGGVDVGRTLPKGIQESAAVAAASGCATAAAFLLRRSARCGK